MRSYTIRYPIGAVLVRLVSVVVVGAFALAFGHSQSGTLQGGTNGAIAVDCDATQVGVQLECIYSPGSSFQVEIHVMEPPTGGYFLFQVKLGWTEGVANYLPTSSPEDEALWSHCTVAARVNNWADRGVPSVFFGCAPVPGLTMGDTFTGAVLTFEFQCKSAPAALSPAAGLDPDQSVLDLIPRVGESPDLQQGGTIFIDGVPLPIDPALTDATVTCAEPAPQGDVNCDNVVNVVDALFILQFEVGLRADSGGCPLPPPPPDTLNAAGGDVNKDGVTNVVDALFILQCEVGLKPGANMPFC